MGRVPPLLCVVVAALAWAGPGGAVTRVDHRVTMDDGVEIATTLLLPDGAAPPGGWPAIMMLHGLGGKRQDMTPIAEMAYVPQGYAVLTYDARGHGESGGLITLGGPREIADARALFDRLRARPDVDDDGVGAWGVSYGGGGVMRLLAEQAPLGAATAFATWTDLYDSLFPQNLAKSGVVFGFLREIPLERSPFVASIKDDALASRNLAGFRVLSDERSSRQLLDRVRVPTFLFQGRRDFAFDMQQAIDGYARLAGPKRLYLGNLGHSPSTFVADDFAYFITQSRLWFDRWLKGLPNGIDTRPPLELAPSPFVESRIGRYGGLPPTRTFTATWLPRARTIGARGKIVRDLPLGARGAIETFGSAQVRVRASTRTSWPHLVAILSALTPSGQEIVISGGGVPTRSLRRPARRLTIRLLSTATFVPAGSRLRVTLAATSLAQNPGNLLYLQSAPTGSTIRVDRVSLTVRTLRTPVSR